MDDTIRQANLARYHARKEFYNRNRKQKDKERIRERRVWLNSLKNKPCKDCGGTFPPRAMDFHHLDGDGFGQHSGFSMLLRKKGYKEIVLEEIKKCVLLCANCHRMRHNEDECYPVPR